MIGKKENIIEKTKKILTSRVANFPAEFKMASSAV
jgi:hypothetical protein